MTDTEGFFWLGDIPQRSGERRYDRKENEKEYARDWLRLPGFIRCGSRGASPCRRTGHLTAVAYTAGPSYRGKQNGAAGQPSD